MWSATKIKKRESTTNNHSPTIMNAPAAPPTNANLIVDFPATRRMQGINHAEVARHVHMRHVQFASEIQGRFIRYPSSAENKAKWYDEEDYRRFGSTMLRDAMEASAKVAAARVDHGTGTATNAKLILSCVGLHHLISRDVPARNRAVGESRMTHVQTVLMAQKLQKLYGIGGPAELASVAIENSRGARERGYRVAVLSASILDE